LQTLGNPASQRSAHRYARRGLIGLRRPSTLPGSRIVPAQELRVATPGGASMSLREQAQKK
ncbi:MAG TPA: hypothetical protein VJ740_06145, partial [Hyphomicrobiaceae bacterium]|nr:hypothetical protein [Hyphomicrobiaceae bacterium]